MFSIACKKSRIIFGKTFIKCIFTFVLVLMISCTSSATEKTDKSDSIGIIALLGDSMTWIGGDNCEKDTGWSHYLKQKFPNTEIDMYARSGATWTNTESTVGDTEYYSAVLDDENVIYDQVKRLINAVESDGSRYPDVVIAFAGGNDAMFRDKRPCLFAEPEPFPDGSLMDIKPSGVTSLAASVELSCRLLQESFPNAKILLVTPTQLAKTTPDIIHQVSNVITEVGESLGIEVLRADNEVDIKYEIERRKGHRFTYDGVHTNPKGARMIADFIIPHIASVCN